MFTKNYTLRKNNPASVQAIAGHVVNILRNGLPFIGMNKCVRQLAWQVFLALAAWMVSTGNVDAKTETYYAEIKGAAIITSATLPLADPLFGAPGWSTIDVIKRVKNQVVVEFDEFDGLSRNADYTYSVELKITGIDASSATSIYTRTFTVSYLQALGSKSPFRQILYLEGFHSVTVEVLTPPSDNSRLRIYTKMIIDRVYDFDAANTNDVTLTDYGSHYMIAEWASIPGADEYELEYVFYNELSAVYQTRSTKNYGFPGSNAYNALFTNNATRINTDQTSLFLTRTFPKGILVFRYRAVHYDKDGLRIEGNWCTYGNANTYLTDDEYTPDGKVITDAFEKDKVWQYQKTIVENDQTGDNITYFDGSLRKRQSTTLYKLARSFDHHKGIYQDYAYDLFGRQVFTTLPYLSEKGLSDGYNYKYLKFLKNTLKDDNLDLIEGSSFDNGKCGLQSVEMTTDEDYISAGRYYSPNCADCLAEEFFKIPNGEGYPYTLQQFTPDNTGRVQAASAPGPQLRLGGGHDTRYFYGKPAQQELDRLFGTEAGYDTKYTKNLVVDPNGQVSVSYLRSDGKVVATALAGTPPDNLTPLASFDDENTAAITQPIKTYSEEGDKRVFTYTLLLSQPSDVTVHVTTTPDEYTSMCKENVCYDCLYDIKLSLSDACGSIVLTKTLSNYQFGEALDTTCSALPDEINDTLFLPQTVSAVGEWFIRKEIQVSRYAIDYYTENFLVNNSCLPDREEIIRNIIAQSNFNCFGNCEECETGLGTEEEFVEDYLGQITELGMTPTDEDSENAIATYQSLRAECEALCYEPSTCETFLEQMKSDYYPGGQYAGYTLDENGEITVIDVNSIFYSGGGIAPYTQVTYLDTNNEPIEFEDGLTPADLTVADFIAGFDPVWILSLVKLHPEYCLYERCTTLESKIGWEDDIKDIDTWNEAVTAGYLSNTNPPVADLINNDPFFSNTPGSAYKTKMQSRLNDVSEGHNPGGTVKLEQLVTSTIFCTDRDMACPFPASPCAGDKDYWWQVYKKLYFGLRQQYACDVMEDENEDCETAIPEGKTSRWICNYNLPDTTFVRDTALLKEYFDENMQASCEANCESYVEYWREQMKNCGLDPLDMDELMDRFVAVCEAGCDPLHPFGATTCVVPSSYGDHSFEDAYYSLVVNGDAPGTTCPDCPALPEFTGLPEYTGKECVVLLPGFETAGDETWIHIASDCVQCDDIHCSVSSITIPTRNGVMPGIDINITNLIGDTCICDHITKLKSCFDEIQGDPEIPNSGSFLVWLNSLSEWQLTSDELAELTAHCISNCVTLSKPFIVPPSLQCGVCKTPAEVLSAFDVYSTECGTPLDTSTSFKLFMNHELSLNLDAAEYLDYINLYNTYYSEIEECSEAFLLCPHRWGDVLPDTACMSQLYTFASDEASRIIAAATDSIRRVFQAEYIAHCLPKSNAEVIYDLNEYHYTLYYYDQAANLVMTVPPEGVHFLADNLLDDVAESRDNGDNDVRPAHTKQTKYWFNSLNQVVKQVSPDAGWVEHWYDRLGRIIVSQKPNQVSSDNYAYSLYDAQGRVIEAGQGVNSTVPDQDDFTTDPETFDTWLTGISAYSDVFRTIYDDAKFVTEHGVGATFGTDGQENLRKRVATTAYYPTYIPGTTPDENYLHASHYSYDVSGNVKSLIQDIDIRNTHMLKKMEYEYEQASGKVLRVCYQRGQTDEFFHAYTYDVNSRLLLVETSRDSMIWDQDANYTYYEYGPLKRKQLGSYNVQGTDYFYTIQGWMKGANASVLDSIKDAGKDGASLTGAGRIASDAAAFTLNYFDGDYESIDGMKNWISNSTDMTDLAPSLFNGNIHSSVYAFKNIDLAAPRAYTYQYDQLNRLLASDAWTGFNAGTMTWTGLSPVTDYRNTFSYSADGNILTQLRRGASAVLDNLSYFYKPSPLSGLYPVQDCNRLNYVDDAAGLVGQGDLPDQSTGNYDYDASGNLISDVSEDQTYTWKHFDKLSGVIKTDGTNQHYIVYGYDAMMNRLFKRSSVVENGNSPEHDTTTYYVRDASGNIMAVYRSKVFQEVLETVPHIQQMYLDELHIYGSERVGIIYPDVNTYNHGLSPVSGGNTDRQYNPDPDQIVTDTLGDRHYELTNHLGNVLATISDRRLSIWGGSSITSYLPEILTSSDYYPFGAQMPGRKYNLDDYRFGFNGKENDNEIKGDGNQQDYGMRMYDPRLGKFLSVDPLSKDYSGWSPYPYAMNSPIEGIDLDGLEYVSSEVAQYEFKAGLVMIKPQVMNFIEPGWNDKIETFYINNQQYIGYNNIKQALAITPPESNEYTNFDGGLSHDVSLDPIRDEQKDNSVPSRRKANGTIDKRYRTWDQTVDKTPTPPGIAPSSRFMLLYIAYDIYKQVDYATKGYDYTKNKGIQDPILEKVKSDVQKALNMGTKIIPKKYQNINDISTIMNILYQGENNSQPLNMELDKIALKIGATISEPRLAEPASNSPFGPVGMSSSLFDFKQAVNNLFVWKK